MQDKKYLKISYTNYRGEQSVRTIKPIKIWFGENEWHKGEQWFLKAYDLDKNAERDFALIDIQNIQRDEQ